MTRIFVRLWFAAFVLFALGVVVHEALVMWTFYSADEAAYFSQFSTGGMHQTATRWAEADDPAAAKAQAEAAWGVPVEAVDWDAVPEEARAALLATGAPTWWDGALGEHYFVVLPDGLAVLRLGPFAEAPWPSPVPRLAFVGLWALGFAALFWAVLRPLDRSQDAVAAAALALAGGDLDTRVAASDAPVAPGMASAFNAMADRLEVLVKAQRRTLRTASHELRTPIARMRIGLHLLETKAPAEAARVRALTADVDELEGLVEEILTHARLEAGEVQHSKEPMDVGALARSVVAEFEGSEPGVAVLADDAMRDLTPLTGSPVLIRRALRNLVANALRHARSEVRIGGLQDADGVRLWVVDDGPGVPEAERDAIWKPFHTRGARGGHGLGLSIVAHIAAWHGGEVALESPAEGGAKFLLRLPPLA